MTRILQIHTRYREPGGEDAVVAEERRVLLARGHEVLAVTRQNSEGSLGAAAQLAGYAFDPRSDRSLLRLAERLRPDVVHVHNTWFGTSPGFLSGLRRAGFPTVATVHNYRLMCPNAMLYREGQPCEECVGRVPWRGVVHRCYRGSAGQSAAAAFGLQVHRSRGTWSRGIDRILALTEFTRAKLIESGIAADRIAVHGNFTADLGGRSAPPSESRRVLCVGRLTEEKGFDLVLRAWREAPPAGLELVVVGDGPEAARLREFSGPGVTFFGRVPREEVGELLLGSRAVLVPSRWYEPHPVIALEAMAAGAPVLAANIGGLGETVRQLGPEWVVPPSDAAAWASALALLADQGAVDRGGAAARGLYEASYSDTVAVDRLEGIYGALITEDRLRRST